MSNLKKEDVLSNILELSVSKTETEKQLQKAEKAISIMDKTFKESILNRNAKVDYDDFKDVVNKNVSSFTQNELEVLLKFYLKNEEYDKIDRFFSSSESIGDFALDFRTKKREYEFKVDYLLTTKIMNETMAGIDKQMEELNNATKELTKTISDTSNILSDDILTYVNYIETSPNSNAEMKKKVLYIRSAYDMTIYKESLKKYPTTAFRCIQEINTEEGVSTIGSKYMSKKKQYNIKGSLIPFISKGNGKVGMDKSFEELFLPPDSYIVPDLFIYSLIRFFAMSDWNDNIKLAHVSIMLILSKITNKEINPELRESILKNIKEYLAIFPKK